MKTYPRKVISWFFTSGGMWFVWLLRKFFNIRVEKYTPANLYCDSWVRGKTFELEVTGARVIILGWISLLTSWRPQNISRILESRLFYWLVDYWFSPLRHGGYRDLSLGRWQGSHRFPQVLKLDICLLVLCCGPQHLSGFLKLEPSIHLIPLHLLMKV